MPNIVILIGASGCGKSTWAADFSKENPSYIVVSSDKMREVVSGSEDAQDDNSKVFLILANMVGYLMLTGHDILIDATNYSARNRKLWNDLARKYDYAKEFFYFNTPLEQCIANNTKRTRKVPENIITKQHTELVLPTAEEGSVTTINWGKNA